MSSRTLRLEALLSKVQTNAAKPRVAAPPVLAAPAAPVLALEPAPALDDLDAPGAGLPPSAGAPLLELDAPDDLGVSAQQDSLLSPLSSSMRGEHLADAAPPSDVTEVTLEEEVDLDSMEEVDLVEEFAGEPSLEPAEDEEPPPESHSGPSRSAPNLVDAIEGAEEEAPLTPPPQSGEGLAAVAPFTGSPSQAPAPAVPTMEQLGETIALEEGPHQEFDLGAPEEAPPVVEPVPSAYEADLPAHPSVYDAELSVPDNARAELERVRLGERSDVRAEVISRPVISTNVVEFVEADRALHPTTFGELLDLTLGL